MIINNMINQKSKSAEQRIVDKLWENGYDEQYILNLKGKIADPLRIKLANLMRDKIHEQQIPKWR